MTDLPDHETQSARMIDFRTSPEHYRHWRLRFEPPVAYLDLDVEERAGLDAGYQLKLNSYDLGVDIELNDAMLRLRFEHPEIATVVIGSAKDRVFSAGANIGMLAGASHAHKVNFCKFTNETRNAIEDAAAYAGQRYMSAIRGTAAGGGYEMALATEHIVLADDGASSVSLPEVALLAVLPGTGGLTRLVDKRKVRRDRADFFCTLEEGMRGRRALEWGLVDELVPLSQFDAAVRARALELAAASDRPARAEGVCLKPLERDAGADRIRYAHVDARLDRAARLAWITISGPCGMGPARLDEALAQGSDFWPLALARELDDLILHLRLNEPALGTWVIGSAGSVERVASFDEFLLGHRTHWLIREIVLYLKRVLKRLEVSSRSLIALIEPGSCFAGTLLEIALACDQSYMLDGALEGDERPAPVIRVTGLNLGPLPTITGLTRIQSRFPGDAASVAAIGELEGADMEAPQAGRLGLVTFTPDDMDWADEVRLVLQARAGFSADALTGMEANLRFPGPETLESKIFGRLSAWQNWIFQRPNATGERGALKRYGTGIRGDYDQQRT